MKAKLFAFSLVTGSLLSLPALAEEGNRCVGNVGNLGDKRDVVQVLEPLYLNQCLEASASDKIFEIDSTFTTKQFGTKPFVAKVPLNQVPFVYTQNGYEYHIHAGKIVGVTKK